jgi:hypothetical protein
MFIMKELTVLELEMVSGAGWLQDGLTSLGQACGAALWKTANDMLSVDLPLVGPINLTVFAPDLGKTLGSSVGNSIGGFLETTLSALPEIGTFFTKLFNA